MDEIEKELADVFIYALEMSVLLGIDAGKTINKKLVQIKKKYPAKLMKKVMKAKKESGAGAESEYWRIKKEYRKKQ